MRSLALAAGVFLLAWPASALAAQCKHEGATLRDSYWKHAKTAHPLVGQVFKGDEPIPVAPDRCTRTPFQQLIVDLWHTIRSGGLVLLGEVHDNPEHHAARADILRPRLEPTLATRDLRPAAVFEHIHTSLQPQLDSFYRKAAHGGRPWRARDLLRDLGWKNSGWPAARIFHPLFDAALRAKQPIYPGNAVRERVRMLVRDQATADAGEAKRLKLTQTMPHQQLDALVAELAGSHCGAVPASALGAMSLAQRYTDVHLADALLEAAGKHGAAFLLAGNGHVRTDRGVPWYARQFEPPREVLAVMLLEVEQGKDDAAAYFPRGPDGAVAADYIMFTPSHQRRDPCERKRPGRR